MNCATVYFPLVPNKFTRNTHKFEAEALFGLKTFSGKALPENIINVSNT